MSKTTFIYALCEPGTRMVRYIGKADRPNLRLSQHIRVSVLKDSHLGNWLRKLKSENICPFLQIVAEVPDAQWKFWEREYIRVARKQGVDLVNATDGGEGCYHPSPETLAKMRKPKAPFSVERCRAISESLKGRKLSEEHKKAIGTGVLLGKRLPPFTPEHCSAISKGKRGTKLPGASSVFIGVSWSKRKKKWLAHVNLYKGGARFIGLFKLEKDAALAYDRVARQIFGPETRTNFPIKCRD